MKKKIHVLVVDDHPMTVDGYRRVLEELETAYCFKIESAFNCDDVLRKIESHRHNFFDIVFLDISLPASTDNTIVSGEGLGLRIRQRSPRTKIIVHTGLGDQQRIKNIFKSLNPEGFVIKSDLMPEVFEDAINSVLKGNTYYSDHTNRLVGQNGNEDIFLDTSDQKILFQLSKGVRMKDLPRYVPLSMATIERRKKKMKMLFGIPDGSDKELLDIARGKGFI